MATTRGRVQPNVRYGRAGWDIDKTMNMMNIGDELLLAGGYQQDKIEKHQCCRTSERAETEKHNTIYLFEVDKETPDNPPAWVEYAIKGGWHEEFEDRTTVKAGFTEKGEPTEREDGCTAVFGLTHTLDRYVNLVDDVVGRDVEKIVFRKLREAGGERTTWIGNKGRSREHFYFDHRPGFGHAEVMELCRRAFCDAVAPYVATPGDELEGPTSDQDSTSC